MKNRELTLRVGDEEMKFNLTNNVRFADDEKIDCMRVDSLIPSIDDVLHDMIEGDPLEKFLMESLSLKDLECEHPFAVQEFSETILAIDKNASTIIVEEENMTPDMLVLKSYLRIFAMLFWVKIKQNL